MRASAGQAFVLSGSYAPAGGTTGTSNWGALFWKNVSESGLVLLRRTTPASTADHAAAPSWLTDSRPRAAVSLNEVVNRSRIERSLSGKDHAASKPTPTGRPVAGT